MSLLTPIPASLGRMLPGRRRNDVRGYSVTRAVENAVSAAPATAVGTNGASSAAPSARGAGRAARDRYALR